MSTLTPRNFEMRCDSMNFGQRIMFILYRVVDKGNLQSEADPGDMLEPIEEVISKLDMDGHPTTRIVTENENIPALFSLTIKQAKDMMERLEGLFDRMGLKSDLRPKFEIEVAGLKNVITEKDSHIDMLKQVIADYKKNGDKLTDCVIKQLDE